ncbi:AAA family ATPase [Desulfosporosinus sp. PR]|uniref:AAA family ATPase n=1 Tax=Candidatus Desulfosporosinus nitrosoreducens TaxID=3401928 RepID=UPI0027F47706|nr:AAA family ATPase [Desulfosporosinus sp. PR]MDQ7091986.1 AAA family ATPase [Desulfosporosinus sp. PR]
MTLKKIHLENFTVFDKMDIEFSDGVNVFIGENGTGKTHIMKLLYAACQSAHASKKIISFPQKIVRVFRPDNSNISRLLSRKAGNGFAKVQVTSGKTTLKTFFDLKTKNWDAEVVGAQVWEKQLSDLTSLFIPAKEILSNSKNLINAITAGNVDFDDTYKDIISMASVDISRGANGALKKKYLEILQGITDGKVKYENEEFYLLLSNQSRLEFQLVAEGLRKIALLWQLIKNGTLEKGTILFWDEPEANINPKHIPALVEILLSLQADGVQIFIATHDYVLAKYLEIKMTDKGNIRFHSLYKKEGNVEIECNNTFKGLANNSIAEAYNKLLDEVFEQTTKG